MSRFSLAALLFLTSLSLAAQHPGTRQHRSPALTRALGLASAGDCARAVPTLRRLLPRLAGQDLREAGLAGITCVMTTSTPADALVFLQPLLRHFPRDPEVLYLATHVYSDLSVYYSKKLLFVDPSSYQVHELDAEALEQQGKWDQAAYQYEMVLKKAPELPGIHFRLARVLLSEPAAKDPAQQAKRVAAAKADLTQELKINPGNAAAEFILGEIDVPAGNWPGAIAHFKRALQLNKTFLAAYIALGDAQMRSHQFADAIPPLKKAEALQPQNPTIHFMLAQAYMRTGEHAEFKAEAARYKEAMKAIREHKNSEEQQLLGQRPGTAPKQ